MICIKRRWQRRRRQARGQNCDTVAGCLHDIEQDPADSDPPATRVYRVRYIQNILHVHTMTRVNSNSKHDTVDRRPRRRVLSPVPLVQHFSSSTDVAASNVAANILWCLAQDHMVNNGLGSRGLLAR